MLGLKLNHVSKRGYWQNHRYDLDKSGGISMGPFHERVFHLNTFSMQISFYSKPNFNEGIAIKFCTFHSSTVVVPCAKLCSDVMPCNCVILKRVSIEFELRCWSYLFINDQLLFQWFLVPFGDSLHHSISLLMASLLVQPSWRLGNQATNRIIRHWINTFPWNSIPSDQDSDDIPGNIFKNIDWMKTSGTPLIYMD